MGWDRIDANSEKEWGKNDIKWFFESMVGIVGDTMLGADAPVSDCVKSQGKSRQKSPNIVKNFGREHGVPSIAYLF
jgi:hypothetical protein